MVTDTKKEEEEGKRGGGCHLIVCTMVTTFLSIEGSPPQRIPITRVHWHFRSA